MTNVQRHNGALDIKLMRPIRRSFGRGALDGGARYDSVSVPLGQKSMRTTETHYARRRYTAAAEELERVLTSEAAVQKTRP
jgi:hypothetical protein